MGSVRVCPYFFSAQALRPLRLCGESRPRRLGALGLHDRDELGFDGAAGDEDRFVGDVDPNRVLVNGVRAFERADRCREGKVTRRGRAFELASGVGHLRSDLLDEGRARAEELELKSALGQLALVSLFPGFLGGGE